MSNDLSIQSVSLANVKTQADFEKALASLPAMDRIHLLKKITEYKGAETTDINKVLNQRLLLKGVYIHEATINKAAQEAGNVVKTIDTNTGEIVDSSDADLLQVERTVLKLSDGKFLGFVSGSILSVMRSLFIPAFGIGDWEVEVPVVISQVSTRSGGRAFNVQVVD